MIGVIAAHAAAFGLVFFGAHEATQAIEPQVLSVSFLTPAEPVKPPEPVPPAPPPPEPVLKPKPKPVIASKRSEPVADAIITPQVEDPDTSPSAPVQAYSEAAEPTPPGQPEPPRFDMAYLSNPQPSFPAMSKKLHEEGTVVLRVHVSATGEALTVEVAKTSGYERLDDAALRAVRKWKFVPSKLGDTAVDGIAMVPMVFALKKQA